MMESPPSFLQVGRARLLVCYSRRVVVNSMLVPCIVGSSEQLWRPRDHRIVRSLIALTSLVARPPGRRRNSKWLDQLRNDSTLRPTGELWSVDMVVQRRDGPRP